MLPGDFASSWFIFPYLLNDFGNDGSKTFYMKKSFLLLFFLGYVWMVRAQGTPGWTPLFNGKDLTGWKQLNGKAKYRVQNGEIVGTTVFGEPNSFLVTEKDYDNFKIGRASCRERV